MIQSREISEARIPGVPIEMPSETTMVCASSGVPPASRIPALTSSANRARCMLQGVTSEGLPMTAIRGLSRSSSLNPVARNIARAGARCGKALISSLRTLTSVVVATQPRTAVERALAKRPFPGSGVRGLRCIR